MFWGLDKMTRMDRCAARVGDSVGGVRAAVVWLSVRLCSQATDSFACDSSLCSDRLRVPFKGDHSTFRATTL